MTCTYTQWFLCLLLLTQFVENVVNVQTSGGRTVRQDASFSPIRITPIMMEPIDSRFQGQLTNQNGALMHVVNYLENTLRVRPIQGNFTLPPTCEEYMSGPNEGKCIVLHPTTQCGIFDVPQRYLGTREVCLTSSSDCSVAGPNGPGAANTDFLLLVGTTGICACIQNIYICACNMVHPHRVPS